MRVAQVYERNLTVDKCLRLEIKTYEIFILHTVAILAAGLLFIWEHRKQTNPSRLFMMRAYDEETMTETGQRSREYYEQTFSDDCF